MSYKEKVQVNTFTATDEVGRTFEVRVYQEFTVSPSPAGLSRLPGQMEFVTDTGLPVAVIDIDAGEFQIMDGSITVNVHR